MKVFVYFSHL